MPEVSVIIPLYNKGPYIARTLNSILNQTFYDFEVIVVDDGSTDIGVKIIKGFNDTRIRLIQQENQGVSAARNRGADEAITEFLTFLDADDEWTPIHLETIMRLRKRYPKAGLYTSAYKVCLPNGKLPWPDYKYIPNSPWEGLLPNYFKSSALGDFPVNASTVGIPKKIFIEVGGFPRGYWYGEDADLFEKIALKYPVAFSWELGAIYHWDTENRACDKRFLNEIEPFIKSARDAINRGEVPPELIEPLNEYIFKKEIYQAIQNLKAGNNKVTQTILRKCRTKWNNKLKFEIFILALIPKSLFLFILEQRRKIYYINKKQ